MFKLIVNEPEAIGPWVFEKAGGRWIPGIGTAIGLTNDLGEALSAAAFTDYNGVNISCHIRVESTAGFRLLLWAIGDYCFRQLGCRRLTLIAESSNVKALKFHEKLGAVHEARLEGAGRNGDDILISRLTPDCRIWRKLDGWKKQSPAGPELRGADSPSRTVEYQSVLHDAERVAG